MPNLDTWINQNNSNKNEEHTGTKTINKLKIICYLLKLNIRSEIRPNLHPTYITNVIKK